MFTDIDECLIHACHGNASCTDNEGSFLCHCNAGFSGDGLNCTSKASFFTVGLLLNAAFFFILFNISCVLFIDIDECNTSPCHYNASCTDNDGSFVCQCNIGFSGDGLNCTSKASFFTLVYYCVLQFYFVVYYF